MKRLKLKKYLKYFIPLIILMIISFLNMYNSRFILSSYNTYLLKQVIYYILGFILLFIVLKTHYKLIYKNIFWLYLLFNILLLIVLFLGKSVNGARAWFNLGFISFQPSEFMKIVLLIYLSKIFSEYKGKDFLLIVKTFFIISIPSALTFLEPDTGTGFFIIN